MYKVIHQLIMAFLMFIYVPISLVYHAIEQYIEYYKKIEKEIWVNDLVDLYEKYEYNEHIPQTWKDQIKSIIIEEQRKLYEK